MSDTEYPGLVPSSASAPTAPVVPVPTYTFAAGATNGVAISQPPDVLLPTITASIERACASIPAGRTGALVALVDTKGANFAVVQRVGGHVEVMAWLGKSWGVPLGGTSGGASIHASW